MPNFCKLRLSGHLGKDAELRHTPKGTAVTSFSVAFNPGKKEDKKPTVWFHCLAFKELAKELASLKKGDGIEIENAFPTYREWERDDKKHSIIEWVILAANKYEPKEKQKEAAGEFNPDDDLPF